MKQVQVSIQGDEGSFHQVAARHFFGKQVGLIACATFRDFVMSVAMNDGADVAVMAIENSIA